MALRNLRAQTRCPTLAKRRPGAGRKRRESEQRPQLVELLERLVDSGTRGDPMSPLRWTCKSTRTLAGGVVATGVLGEC